MSEQETTDWERRAREAHASLVYLYESAKDESDAQQQAKSAILELDTDYILCSVCATFFDARHLDQVIAHEHGGPHLALGLRGEAKQ